MLISVIMILKDEVRYKQFHTSIIVFLLPPDFTSI